MLLGIKLLVFFLLTLYFALNIKTLLTEEDFEVLDAVQSYSNMDRVRNFFSNFPVHPRRPEGQLAIGVAGGW